MYVSSTFSYHFALITRVVLTTSDLFPSGQAEYEIPAVRFTGTESSTHLVCVLTMNRRYMSESPDIFSQTSHYALKN